MVSVRLLLRLNVGAAMAVAGHSVRTCDRMTFLLKTAQEEVPQLVVREIPPRMGTSV
jgi:hypothetical protein